MPTHNSSANASAQATPARARKNNPWTIITCLAAGLGVGALFFGPVAPALSKMLFRSAVDRNDDIGTGNKAVDEAVGRAHLRKVDKVVEAIDSGRIDDPDSLNKELGPARENTEKMRAVARGDISQQLPTSTRSVHNAPAAQREPIKKFQLLDPTKKAYQLDGREDWHELDITAITEYHLKVKADGRVCSAEQQPCAGPNGILGPARNYHNIADLVASKDATVYALIGKWGNDGEPFQIGSNYDSIIPASADGKKLFVMANVTTAPQNLADNSGGHVIETALVYNK